MIEQYAGTSTWVFGVDGDELYDAARLEGFREDLLGGGYDGVFKVASNVLNCVELDPERARGYLSPPSRSITKLYNFAAIDEWRGDGSERQQRKQQKIRRGESASVNSLKPRQRAR